MLRTFIAIDVPETVRKELGDLQDELKKTQAPVSWVKSDRIHITLKFLGNVAPEQIPAIQVALEEVAADSSGFHLEPYGCGAFPSLSNMRVVWVGLRGDDQTMQKLYRLVDSSMTNLGFNPEDRPFRPHLTVGRVKGRRHLRSLQNALLARQQFTAEAFDVTEVVLYKSDLKPQGAQYTPLFRAALTGQNP